MHIEQRSSPEVTRCRYILWDHESHDCALVDTFPEDVEADLDWVLARDPAARIRHILHTRHHVALATAAERLRLLAPEAGVVAPFAGITDPSARGSLPVGRQKLQAVQTRAAPPRMGFYWPGHFLAGFALGFDERGRAQWRGDAEAWGTLAQLPAQTRIFAGERGGEDLSLRDWQAQIGAQVVSLAAWRGARWGVQAAQRPGLRLGA